MLPTLLPAWWMSAAGLAVLAIGLVAAKDEIARARGIDKIVALTFVCFAVPLAVFGAEHFTIGQSMTGMVPKYMPWREFWVYFVGVALIVASLSIATRRQVRWSGLLFGAMMFLFVAMVHLPGAIRSGDRIVWTVVFREMSFAGGAWVLAGTAGSRRLIAVGRVLIAITAIFFGVEHFLHPLALPGVPLVKLTPTWVPLRAGIDYLTGALLVATGVCFLLARKAQLAATYLGAWIVFLVIVIYGPVLIGALGVSNASVQIEGVNYFADTLLFGAAILSVANAGRPLKTRG